MAGWRRFPRAQWISRPTWPRTSIGCSMTWRSGRPDRRHVVAGECMPVVDVFETEKTVEIVLDLPGRRGRRDAHPVQGRRAADRRREGAARSHQARPGELSPGRARLRALRARGANQRRHRRLRRRAPGWPTASCASCCRASPSGAAPDMLVPIESPSPATRMKLLFLGDIVGRPGRDLIRRHVRALASRHGADLVIANGENAAGGAGITRENMLEILSARRGRDHDRQSRLGQARDARVHRQRAAAAAARELSGRHARRRARTSSTAKNGVRVGVINVMGRVFLHAIDDPFRVAEREIARVRGDGAQVIFVDMHAETTSEKIALCYYLDGKVAAVIGTHTHVQTADERILPGGTACLTDVGMTGPHDGVIGMDKDAIIARFVSGLPARFETGDRRSAAARRRRSPSIPRPGSATAIERISLIRRRTQRHHRQRDGGARMSRLPLMTIEGSKAAKVPEVPKASFQAVPTVAHGNDLEPLRTSLGTSGTGPEPSIRTVLTVSELNATIRDLLENQLQNVWVEGEISNARVWNTGHMYFTLKDGASQIKAVMFRSAVRYLKFKPEDGLKVVARGKISVYDPKGEYQILCEHLEPKGLGSLQQAFEQLKKKLAAEGLFDHGAQAAAAGAAPPHRPRHLDRRRGAARHHSRAAAPLSERAPGDLADARAGRRRRPRSRARHPQGRAHRGRRRDHRRARRRLARRSVGVQRRGAGARDRRLAGAGDLRRRPRNRFHDRGFRRRPARADAVGGRRARGAAQGRVLRAHRSHRRAARRGDASSRCAAWRRGCTCSKRGPGYAGLRRTAGGPRPPRLGAGGGAAAAHQPGRRAARRGGTSCCGARSISSIRAIGSPRFARGWCRATGSCRRRCGAGCSRAQTRLGALAARSTASARWRCSAAAIR